MRGLRVILLDVASYKAPRSPFQGQHVGRYRTINYIWHRGDQWCCKSQTKKGE